VFGPKPIVTSLTALGALGVDASLEEAARVVARPARVVLHILLPAARPAIAFALIVVFALSLSELGVPMFLRVEVFPAAVFARLGGHWVWPADL
jgi:iron(III) transport system permease protein